MADEQQLQASLAELGKRHAHVSYALIAVIVSVLLLACAGGAIAVHFGNKLLAQAEAKEQTYRDDQKALLAQLDQDKQTMLQLSVQQKTVEHTIEYRDQQTAQTVQQVVAPKPVQDVAADVVKYLAVTPSVTPDNLLAFQPSDVQNFVADKVKLGQTTQDYADRGKILDLEKQKGELCQQDLTKSQTANNEANTVIGAYKKAAVASKKKKFFMGALHILEVVGGGYIGYKIGTISK